MHQGYSTCSVTVRDHSYSEGGDHLERYRPCLLLRPYVEVIWIQENSDLSRISTQSPTTIVPTGILDLLVFYHDPYVRSTGGAYELEPTFLLTGQRTRSITVSPTGRSGVLLVRFRPWGAAQFFSQPVDSMTDQSIAVEDLVGSSEASEVECRVHDATNSLQRVRIIEEFLVRRLRIRPADVLAANAAIRIKNGGADTRISAIASELGISQRQLARRFQAAIGMSPKQFSVVMRFQESIGRRREGWDWTTIAATCGFHDQAHLIRTWKTLANGPPGKLLDDRRETPWGRFFRNRRIVSDFYNTTYV